MKKIFSILIVLAMVLSAITAVYAESSCNIELSGIEYVLKKGAREVNIVTLSNKMEVRAKLKNTAKSSQTVKVRVDGYKDGGKVSAQTRTSEEVLLGSGAISDVITVNMGNVKTYCDTVKVFAVTAGGEKQIAVFPYISLGIKLNGVELENYSDDKDEYTAVLNTPYPYFEIEERSVTQKDLNKGFDYKLPYTRTITVSQTGKDDAHKLDDRTITIHLDTTSAAISHISNENMIFWTDAKTNNTDRNVYDYNATVWTDLSGYKNNVDKVYDIWTGKGLKVTSKWDTERLTTLPKKLSDTVNSGSFTIKFTPSVINDVDGANLCLFGSDNGNFRIFVKKNSGKLYFKWGDVRYTPEMVSVNISEAEGKENAITVASDGTVTWYVDKVGKSQKTYSLTGYNTVNKLTLSDVKEGNVGSVVFDEIKFFDKALSQSEIENSDILHPDTTMTEWYNNVEAGISLCGRLGNGTDTLNSTNVLYFCLPNDTFAQGHAALIAQGVKGKLDSNELEEDFISYNKVAKLAESVIIQAKSSGGSDIATDELVAYINNTYTEDISKLLDTIDDSTVADIKNTVNSTNTSSGAEFEDLVKKQLILASVTKPKYYSPAEVAGRIIAYSSDLGLNLNGFASAANNKKNQIALNVMNLKPTTVAALEAIIASGMSNTQGAGGGTGGGGGNVSTGGSNPSGGGGGLPTTPSSPQPQQDTPPVVTIAGFDDMYGSEWVGPALEYMVENGYVSGVGDNKFAPKANITRSEFVAIISRCEAFEEVGDTETVFDDVPTDFWGYKNIMTAYKNGIISGVGEGKFDPYGNITRQDIAVILYNVYKMHKLQEENDTGFNDWNEISDYAKEAVGKLHALKILNGYGSEYKPKGLCTRAEAVQAIYSYLQAVNQ